MSILSKIKSWLNETREYYAQCLYREDNFPLYWLIRKVLSKVSFTDEKLELMKKLSEQGVVIYALKHKSQLDSLAVREISARKGLARPAYSHGVNMIVWQPFAMAARAVFFFLFYLIFKQVSINPYKSAYLKRITLKKRSSIIHLGGSEYFEDSLVENALRQLVEAQRGLEVPIYLVPALVYYSRRREKEREKFIDILFGQTEDMGPLRRIITYLLFTLSNKTSLITAEPMNLAEYMDENSQLADGELLRGLRTELLDGIDEEIRAIVGPYLKSKDEMISMVLQEKDLIDFMEVQEGQGKMDYEDLAKEAKKYLGEIASDYNETVVNIWDKILTWLWDNIYDGVIVDHEGIAGIRNISKRMPFVIIPCHRSQIDYFLLSHVFYKNNIQLPFIWAGDNLSFFPVGYIFRKSGAFFVRRTFRGNLLYGRVVYNYVKMLLQEGLPLEFFIEGGRSRTGKMVMPKYGVLSMIIQAYQEKACDNLAAIPVYIGYDRVIEEKSYLRELGGEQKVAESTADVIRTSKLLRKRYGQVYVNIGKPILFKEYLAAQEKNYEEMTVEERRSLYRKIGYEIVLEISNASVVTPYAIISAGLLSHDRRGIAQDDLLDVLNAFHDYLSERKVKFANTLLVNRAKAIRDALVLLDQSGLISRMVPEDEGEDEAEEVVYSLADDKRLNLEYYKNGILHFFLPICFVATSILSFRDDMIPLSDIIDDYQFLKKLFWHEFIFDITHSNIADMNEVLTYLYNCGMIAGEERDYKAWIEVKGKGRTNLMPFAGLLSNYIESYWVVIRGCHYLRKKPLPEKELLKKLLNLGTRMYRKGEIRRAEALSQSNYQSALEYLKEAGIILPAESQEKSDRRDAKIYSLSEDRSQLELLRRRLFKFL